MSDAPAITYCIVSAQPESQIVQLAVQQYITLSSHFPSPACHTLVDDAAQAVHVTLFVHSCAVEQLWCHVVWCAPLLCHTHKRLGGVLWAKGKQANRLQQVVMYGRGAHR